MKRISLFCVTVSLLLFVVGMAVAADSTVSGIVSDSQCGAKGADATHAACMTKCLGRGAKAVIVTDTDQKVLTVDNPDTLKGHEGHHIAATGTVTGDSIHINTVKML
jgi:regulator of extracellular matrix RemA (YlzA/DUF370 family)